MLSVVTVGALALSVPTPPWNRRLPKLPRLSRNSIAQQGVSAEAAPPAPLEVEEAATVVPDPLALPEIVGIVAPVAAPPLGYAPQLDESFTWSTIPELGFANEPRSGIPNEFGVTFDEEVRAPDTFVPPAGTPAVTVAPDYPAAPTFRECFGFLAPALSIYIAAPLMSLIDAGFVGRVAGSLELAALGPAAAICDTAFFLVLFISIGATNLVARAHGQSDDGAAASASTAALVLGLGAGLAMGALVFGGAAPLSALYCGGGGAIATHCATYVRIRGLAMPAAVVASVAQAVCIGTKDARSPLASVMLAAGLNLIGDFALVLCLGRGIAGAAWATAASQLCAALLLLRSLGNRGFIRLGAPQESEDDRPDASSAAAVSPSSPPPSWRASVRPILGFFPFMWVTSMKMSMHNAASATAAMLGGAAAAAHSVLYALAFVCFTFGDVGSSLSQAYLPAFNRGSVTDGGEEDASAEGGREGEGGAVAAHAFDMVAARPTINKLVGAMACVSSGVVALAAFVIAKCGPSLTSDLAVVAQMRRVLPLMSATLCMHGVTVLLEGLLIAKGDFTLLNKIYTAVVLSIAAMFLGIRGGGGGLLAVWAVYVWYNLSRIVAFVVWGGLLPKVFPDLRNNKPDPVAEAEPVPELALA